MILFWTLVSIIAVFFAGILVQKIMKKEFCAICIAVSTTWVVLLLLLWSGVVQDAVLVALLIGQSITGLFYVLEKNVKKQLTVFRLPFLLTLTVVAYFLVGTYRGRNIVLLIALWFGFGVIYVSRNSSTKALFTRILECCKRW